MDHRTKTTGQECSMRSKQDGREIPPYAAQTAREIGKAGFGGHGNMESEADAARRGVTPRLAADVAARAARAHGTAPSESGSEASPDRLPSDEQK
jgi:hypothetical protein